MKKQNRFGRSLAVLLAAGTMCAAMPVLPFSASAAGTMTGDVDLSGEVGVSDIVLLQQYLLGQKTLSEDAFANADIVSSSKKSSGPGGNQNSSSGDGKVNVYDRIALERIVLNSGSDNQNPGPTQPTETTEPTEDTTQPTGSTDPTDPTEEPTTNPNATGVVTAIEYSSSGVTLKDADGNVVDPSDSSNVAVSGLYVTILAPIDSDKTDYVVTGSASEAQLKINSDNDVYLSFEGLTLSNSTAAPVYAEDGDVVLTVKKGTENTISDGTTHTDTYTNSDGETKEVNGAIFTRDDLKIKGKGTLYVNGNYEDGIVCKNDLKLWNSTIIVNAVDDGVRGDDSVRIGDPDSLVANGGDGDYSDLNVTVTTQTGDGIKSTETDDGCGLVRINGGTVNITSYADGIQAEQTFEMYGGDVAIYTYEGSGYTASGSSSGSSWGGGMDSDGNSNKVDISAKGIKSVGLYGDSGETYQSEGNLSIYGGTLVIDSSDDALHCGGNMTVTGGTLTLSSADDGMHSDNDLTIGTSGAGTFDDVQIYIPKCYEGVEGVYIYQESGTVYIISDDDGYNSAGGADSSGSSNTGGPGGGFGQGGMNESYGEMYLDGGLVVVNSASGDHDAFDSNGPLYINGGYYCANGNEPMDCGDNYSISYNGGSVIEMEAGNTSLTTRYTFTDSSGNAVVSFLSGSGGSALSTNTTTAQSGGTLSGGTDILTQAGNYKVTIGGTLSGGTTLSTTSNSGGNQGGNNQGGNNQGGGPGGM